VVDGRISALSVGIVFVRNRRRGKERENETGISPENEMLYFSSKSREGLDEIVTKELWSLELMC
jgi:hypothetical protein